MRKTISRKWLWAMCLILLSISAPGFQKEQSTEIQELIEKLDSRNWDVVAEQLGKMGESAVEPLILTLTGNRGRISWNSASALAQTQSRKGLETMVSVLRNPELEEWLRGSVANAFKFYLIPEARRPLLDVLSDSSYRVRMYTVRSLGYIGGPETLEPLIGKLADISIFVRREVPGALARIGSGKVVQPLLTALADPDLLVRLHATRALVEIGEPAVEAMALQLTAAEVDTRRRIATALTKIQSQKTIPVLLSALTDPDRMVRDAAAAGLAGQEPPPGPEPLLALLAHRNPDVRISAAWLLGEWKHKTAVSDLIAGLRDNHSGWMAAVALGKMGAVEAVKPLAGLLKSANLQERRAAAWALARLSAALTVQYLKRSLKDSDEEVRMWATQALKKREPKEDWPLYPELLANKPDISSPYTTTSGRELILVETREKQYGLIDVTLENSDNYEYYKNGTIGKGRQLEIDADDFSGLAKDGLHLEIELDMTASISGRSISEITYQGRPGRSSGAGFMAADEDIISVLRGDNRLVRAMGLTHPQLARPLFHLWNSFIREYELNRMGRSWPSFEILIYNGQRIQIKGQESRGFQESIFADGIQGAAQFEVKRPLSRSEKSYLSTKYKRLTDKQMAAFIIRLTQIHTGEMVPYYIMRYGFYEGHTSYRADPIALALIFGFRSLEQIEEAFNGKLYEAVTEHFSAEVHK